MVTLFGKFITLVVSILAQSFFLMLVSGPALAPFLGSDIGISFLQALALKVFVDTLRAKPIITFN